MTCEVNPEVYYYGPCDGANDCYFHDGKSWRREKATDNQTWSPSCSAGGWYASSRELIEFLSAIRYRKMLGQAATNMLLNTGMLDIDDFATALGWDPPWVSADGEKNLNKGGYYPFNGVASKTFIQRLPNNCDAVLQLNSETDLSGTNLVRSAYDTVVLDANSIVQGGDYNTPPGFDHISKAAVSTVRTTSDTSSHIVASRSFGGGLRLRAFRASRLPAVPDLDLVDDQTAAGIGVAIGSDDVAVSDGPDFATASIGTGSVLNVIAWKWSGNQLKQYASGTGVNAREVAIAKVAAAGTVTRVVTAVRDWDFKLRLDVWDMNNIPNLPQLSSITHKGTFAGNFIGEAVDIKAIGPLVDFTKPSRIIVATLDSSYDLVVRSFEVTGAGNLTSLDSESFSEFPVTSWDTKEKISIDTAGDGISKFFDGKGFMTSYIAGSRKLTVVTWWDPLESTCRHASLSIL